MKGIRDAAAGVTGLRRTMHRQVADRGTTAQSWRETAICLRLFPTIGFASPSDGD
jgi:hypothetical protein